MLPLGPHSPTFMDSLGAQPLRVMVCTHCDHHEWPRNGEGNQVGSMRLDLSGKESYLSAAVAKRGESKHAHASVLFDDWIQKSYKR